MERFTVGATDKTGDCGNYGAGIDVYAPGQFAAHEKPCTWYSRIEVYGPNAEAANQLRDEVLGFLVAGDTLQRKLLVADDLLLGWYEANARCAVKVDDSAYHLVTATAEVIADNSAMANAELEKITAMSERLDFLEKATALIDGKYSPVLRPFVAMMEAELHANSGKGDRPGWLSMSTEVAMLEVFYHVGKLQRAAKRGDVPGIKEYAADVANMAMMLVDVFGGLDVEDAP